MARRLPSKPSLSTDPCPSGQWPSCHASHRHANSCLHALFRAVPFASLVLDLRATPLLSCLVITVQSCRRRTQDPPTTSWWPQTCGSSLGSSSITAGIFKGREHRWDPVQRGRWHEDLLANLWKIKPQPTPASLCRVPDSPTTTQMCLCLWLE